ncbi:LOW QUALITY PROTEIN: hypothetical protein Cgig2_021189 [Carnegiea gigantea]|uniref:Uncharacterized protein n=1 Tax=Carnegiea gigantea TaxID=171969 RepID=A0A9Q1QQE4_9CARY|nr:LOW QUALITY PROTEIN: hypothetical protein Cgig2_021189 [Carnegiea gigantea]
MDGSSVAAHDRMNYKAHQLGPRGVAFPPSPLPKDFQSLCPDFDLATAEQAAAYYELRELSEAIFYVILPNEAKKLGVLHGPRLRSLEVALTELRWGAFESWIWLFGDRVYEGRFRPSSSGEGARTDRQGEASSGGASLLSPFTRGAFRGPVVIMAFPPTHSTREMANYVREVFTWRRRSTSRPPRPLPGDFKVLCPHFSLAEAEAAVVESGLPEIATFYAMLLNDMLELGAVHEYTAKKMRSVLVDLGWSAFEAWMRIMDPVIQGAQLYHQPDEVEIRRGQGESSGSVHPLAPSSDEE